MSDINVSVVVPCYNVAQTFARCIESLINQTAQNYEIICVNDGSTDATLEIISSYAERYPHLVRCIDQKNAGLWNARWSGTDVAVGEYVAYVDSDDYADPCFVESFYATAKEHDADIVVCGFKRIDEDTQTLLSTEMNEARDSFFPQSDPGSLISINSAAWNKLFRRSLLGSMHRLENPPAILEDVALSQLAYLAANKRVAFTGNAPYCYMIHADSMINTITAEQIESVRKALLEIRHHFEQEPNGKKLIESYDTTVFLHMGIAIPFRVSASAQLDLSQELALMTDYLNEHFPYWRTSQFITLGYSLRHGGAFLKLYIASCFYKLHLMRPFLAAYRFVVERLHIEIKW